MTITDPAMSVGSSKHSPFTLENPRRSIPTARALIPETSRALIPETRKITPRPQGSALATYEVPSADADIFDVHRGGKLTTTLRYPLEDTRALSLTYTPGVAKVSAAIAGNPQVAAEYTWAHRLVAVISDGTAVLGLGDIGASAALPVMEGKAALFKQFGGLDSIPIVLNTRDVDEIVETVVRIAPSFGAVNLEDISAPRCFEVERRLVEALDIPVMHDDQHGTAVVVLAGLTNAAAVLNRELVGLRVVIVGAGAAGVACARILTGAGVGDLIVLDSRGILSVDRAELTGEKAALALTTNPRRVSGDLTRALRGADVVICVSGGSIDPGLLTLMAADPIVFALANPTPEIHPTDAARYARIVATGRSDFPNQINNVLAFPGIFRGALDCGATRITEGMKLAAARAIAGAIPGGPTLERIVPGAFEPGLAEKVSAAVIVAAHADGVARS